MLKISPNAFDASSTTVAQSSINAVANKRLQHLWAETFPVEGFTLSRYYLQKCRFFRSILPIMAILSFSLIEETSLKSVVPPKCTETSLTVIIVVLFCGFGHSLF
jgi:hypothetical protein